MDLKEKDLQIAGLNGKRAEEKAAYLIRTYTIGGILILALLLLIILVISMHKRKIAFHLKQLKLEKEIKEKEMQRQLLLTDMHKKMTERYICGLEDSHNRISKELHDGKSGKICATFRISWQLLPSATLACTRYSHFTRIS